MSVASRDLLAISARNLVSRAGRTLFLSAGVLIGTGLLLFVIGLIGGVNDVVQVNIDRSVEKVKREQREILARQQGLQDRLQALIGETPVHRIELMPREGAQGEIKESDVESLKKEHGPRIARIVTVAFLFPMFAELRLVDFEIELGGESIDFARFAGQGQRIPITIYGVDPEEMEGRILGPDEGPSPDAARFRYSKTGRVPVVIPAEYYAMAQSMRNEDMKEKLRDDLTKGLFAMMLDPRNRERFAKKFGENFLTRKFAEEAIETAIEQIYEKLKPENVKNHFEVTLYSGLTREEPPMPAEIVGMSRTTPQTGLTVPEGYVARWHQDHFAASRSGLTRLFSGKPEVNYSKVILYGKDLDATIDLVDRLRERYLVASQVDQARRLRDESRRIDADRADLEAKEAELLAESDRIREIVGAIRDGAWLVGILVFLLAGVGIVNGQTLSVLEQAKRIGILRAVGARRRDILFIFLTEAILIGLVGSALGVLAAEGAILLADLRLPQALPEMAYRPESFFQVGWALRGLVVAVGVVVSFAAGLIPAVKGAWIRPIEVLKD